MELLQHEVIGVALATVVYLPLRYMAGHPVAGGYRTYILGIFLWGVWTYFTPWWSTFVGLPFLIAWLRISTRRWRRRKAEGAPTMSEFAETLAYPVTAMSFHRAFWQAPASLELENLVAERESGSLVYLPDTMRPRVEWELKQRGFRQVWVAREDRRDAFSVWVLGSADRQ